MHRFGLAVALIMIATACMAQEPGTTQAGAAASAGTKTIRGCVGIGSPRCFVINTTDGRSLPLFTDRDLSAFVGKQVEIRTRWQRRGLTMAEQSSEGSTGTGTSENPAAGSATADTREFAGSISVSFTGKVLGPCPKK